MRLIGRDIKSTLINSAMSVGAILALSAVVGAIMYIAMSFMR